MATRTDDQLIQEVAAILGKFVPGEALGPVENDTISNCIDEVLEEIDGIVSGFDREEIPLKYFETIARLTAIHAASKFSNTPLDIAGVQDHEQRLRYLAANEPGYGVARGEYY